MIKLYTKNEDGTLTYIGKESSPVKLAKKYKLDLPKINNVLTAINVDHRYALAYIPGTHYAIQEE